MSMEYEELLNYLSQEDNLKKVILDLAHRNNPFKDWYKGKSGYSRTEIPLDGSVEDVPFKDLLRWMKQTLAFYTELLPFFTECMEKRGVAKFGTYSMLDIGPGTGAGSNLYGQLFSETHWGYQYKIIVDTTDIDERMNSIVDMYPFIHRRMNENIFDLQSKSYDIVFCSHVIEHVDNPIEFAEKCRDISNRFVFISCPINEYDPIPGHRTVPEELIDSLKPFYKKKYKSVNRWREELECIVFALD